MKMVIHLALVLGLICHVKLLLPLLYLKHLVYMFGVLVQVNMDVIGGVIVARKLAM